MSTIKPHWLWARLPHNQLSENDKVEPQELTTALGRSSRGIISLLQLGFDRGGKILRLPAVHLAQPAPRRRARPDLFVADEGHHRGQIVMLARELGYRLPVEVTGELWQWAKRSQETRKPNEAAS
ncbi:MAG: hypothetical protein QOD75_2813 [Blastocatellia bacterium]|jgi:hypothetical protein|nr:hypothetical protein [Blastocatellia bacterium]